MHVKYSGPVRQSSEVEVELGVEKADEIKEESRNRLPTLVVTILGRIRAGRSSL